MYFYAGLFFIRVAQISGYMSLDAAAFFKVNSEGWLSSHTSYMCVSSSSFLGHAHSFDDVIIDGDVDEQKFTAYYVK